MKKIFTLISICIISLNVSAQSNLTFHDYSGATILGDTINFSQYYGKKVMVVNTASFCAYTPQYADLDSLYAHYHQYNFEIIGFPCNDFGGQDPHDDSTINQFCQGVYGVQFQMMSKVATISADTAPVYKWLQRADLNGVANAHVAWNFNKFCIDEAGHWVAHYFSPTLPEDTAITNWILSPSVISSVKTVNDLTNLIQITSANPTNSSIDFEMRVAAKSVTVAVYSVDGRMISKIYNDATTANQRFSFSTVTLAQGIYFVKLNVNGTQQTIKYVVVK